MKEFRKPGNVDSEAIAVSKANAGNEYVFYTGTVKTNNRKASGRTAVLSLVKEKRKPVPLATFYDRAARAAGNKGFDPAFARGGLALAGLAKPAVYFLLYRDGDAYRAAVNIPNPDENYSKRPFKKGDVVYREEGKAKPETPALPSPTPATGG